MFGTICMNALIVGVRAFKNFGKLKEEILFKDSGHSLDLSPHLRMWP